MDKKEVKKKEDNTKKLLEPKVIIALAAFALLVIFVVWGMTAKPCCSGSGQTVITDETPVLGNTTDVVLAPKNSSVKVEIYHFHRTQQCGSCIQLGKLAEKTVNTYFADELSSGKLAFGHINYELPENSALSDKFGPSGASLWIGTTIDRDFTKEEDIKVWYKLQDEEGFMSYLKGVIEKRLGGDLTQFS